MVDMICGGILPKAQYKDYRSVASLMALRDVLLQICLNIAPHGYWLIFKMNGKQLVCNRLHYPQPRV